MKGVPAAGEEIALIWLKERGINLTTGHGLVGSVRSKGKEYIVFNYYYDGECINHKYRATFEKKFFQDPEPHKTLFNIDEASKYDEIYIVEGEVDALAFISEGIMNVASVPDGAPANVIPIRTRPEEDVSFSYLINCVDKLKGKKFIICTDSDHPGECLRNSLVLRLGRGNCDVVEWPSGVKDASDFVSGNNGDLSVYIKENRKPYEIKGLRSWNDVPHKDDVAYYPCPIPGLGDEDEIPRLNIAKRNLYVVTGIPGHGKSAFAKMLAVGMAYYEGWHISIGSFEDDVYLDLQKELGTIWNFFVDTDRTLTHKYEREEERVKISEHFSFVFDEGVLNEPMTVNWMIERMYDAKSRFNMDMMVIDPWNQLDHVHSREMTDALYIHDALRKFKKAAMDLNIALVIVAHPRKMYEDETPTLYHINGSAAWNDKTDGGIVVHRPNYKDPRDNRVEIEVLKLKRRSLGVRGKICLEFNPDTLTYHLPIGQ
jgi:twinkle protein